MSLKDESRKMINELATRFPLPPTANIFFPPFYKSGQPKDVQFMAISLEGGATGISRVTTHRDFPAQTFSHGLADRSTIDAINYGAIANWQLCDRYVNFLESRRTAPAIFCGVAS